MCLQRALCGHTSHISDLTNCCSSHIFVPGYVQVILFCLGCPEVHCQEKGSFWAQVGRNDGLLLNAGSAWWFAPQRQCRCYFTQNILHKDVGPSLSAVWCIPLSYPPYLPKLPQTGFWDRTELSSPLLWPCTLIIMMHFILSVPFKTPKDNLQH